MTSVVTKSVERKQFQLDTGAGSIDISIGSVGLNIKVDNDWVGDTESGFGASCNVDISVPDAIAMAKWILETYEP